MKTPEQVIADTVTGTTGRHSYIVGAQAAGFIIAALAAAGYVIGPDWQPAETAPYSTSVLAWLHLPKNPDASGSVIGEHCCVQKDEPEEYEEMQQTVGCWWANGRYYHRGGHKEGGGYITHWKPLAAAPNAKSRQPEG